MRKNCFLKAVSLITAVITLALQFSGCVILRREPEPDPTSDNYRVFYEIFVGSFSDSDGDGTGDLRGIINRMDYLNDGDISTGDDLGVQGIWLSPVFSSPSYHKYDAADYYGIDEAFGTEEDLAELFRLCHERNVKVILDLPINHTSNANIWFQKFSNAHKAGDESDPYYDFYSYCVLGERKGGRKYETIPGCADEYYECNFSSDMPELNFDSDKVRQAVVEVAKYYLDLGADGFRFDAVKYIYYSENAPSVDFWKWYMNELRGIKEDIYCVGECWSNDAETLGYIDAMNCFNFQTAQSEGFIANAARGGTISVFLNYIEVYTGKLGEKNNGAMLIPFISNHDMDRSAGYLPLATGRMNMAANLYLLCAGSPFIYYGEEIGMRGSRGASNTDANRRLAMLWGDGDTVTDPVGTTYASSKQTNGTVKSQTEDKDSLMRHYASLIALRIKYPCIARGDYSAVTFESPTFGGFLVSYEGSCTGIIHNTSDSVQTFDLKDASGLETHMFTELCDKAGKGEAKLEGTVLTIGAQTSVILK